jgi:hypothetical protein
VFRLEITHGILKNQEIMNKLDDEQKTALSNIVNQSSSIVAPSTTSVQSSSTPDQSSSASYSTVNNSNEDNFQKKVEAVISGKQEVTANGQIELSDMDPTERMKLAIQILSKVENVKKIESDQTKQLMKIAELPTKFKLSSTTLDHDKIQYDKLKMIPNSIPEDKETAKKIIDYNTKYPHLYPLEKSQRARLKSQYRSRSDRTISALKKGINFLTRKNLSKVQPIREGGRSKRITKRKLNKRKKTM